MIAKSLAICDVILLQPQVLEDERGFFFESFNLQKFENLAGRSIDFVQDNHSRSVKNVLRGLHYQVNQPQGKLVRVTQGEVFDVAVDLRTNSSTYGHWVSAYLSAENKHQLWIPEGFAHGFKVLSDTADFVYKVTSYYSPENERSLLWSDNTLAIDWPNLEDVILSGKDANAPPLAEAEVFC